MTTLRNIAGLIACAFISLGAVMAAAQHADQVGQDLHGQHSAHGAPDPYVKTQSTAGANCCHGTDCARWYGEPERVTREGVRGWLFGKWFFRDDQMIDVTTLTPEERGFHHVCIGEDRENGVVFQIPRCA